MTVDTQHTLATGYNGQHISQCHLEPIEVNLRYYISQYILASSRQCFTDMYVSSCTCGNQSRRIMGCVLGHLVGSQWNLHV